MMRTLRPPKVIGKPLRIAHITDTFAPAVNGVVRSVESTADALRSLGHRVHVFAPATRSFAKDAPRDDVTWFPAIETNIYPSLHVSVLPILPKHLRGFDVVHVHTPGPLGLGALLSAKRAGVPAVYTYHTRFDDLLHYISRVQSAERILARAAHRVHRAILLRAAAVIAPTPTIAEELTRDHACSPDVVGTGVDTSVFSPASTHLSSRSAPLLLALGRLSPEKRIDAIIRAMPIVRERAPGATLHIAGSGPDRARLERLVVELELASCVQFLGRVPEARLAQTYRKADVFVTASRFETQGLTVLEAMACGTPCAVADVPVFRDLGERATERFDVGSPETIARAVLAAHSKRDELRRRGLDVARASSVEASAEKLSAIYARLS